MILKAPCSVHRILNLSCAPSDTSILCIFDRKCFLTSQQPRRSPHHINMLWGREGNRLLENKLNAVFAHLCDMPKILQPYRLYHICSVNFKTILNFMLFTSTSNFLFFM